MNTKNLLQTYGPPPCYPIRRGRGFARLAATGRTVGFALAWLTHCACAEVAINRFGFTGPEIFPIDSQISLLHAADLDGDGLNDLIVVNNARSKINLLYNQTGKTNPAAVKAPATKREQNELPPDARFRIDAIASEKRIGSMVVTDLNGDGKPDIAYYGDPKELVVIYNEGPNGWSAPKRWPIEDGLLDANGLTSGDLNGDGRTDLVLLAENHFYLIPQKEDHTLGEAEKIPIAAAAKSVQVLDIDGDGRQDVLLVNFDSATPFRFRLQNADGQLGPEVYFKLPPIHSYWGDNLEAGRQTFIVTVAANSGRAQISQFTRKPAEPLSGEFQTGQFQVLPLGKTDKAKRGSQWADVNGDGLADLLVAEPERGQLSIYLQKPDGSLGAPRAYPTLAGVSDIAVSDWDGDGKAEIFLLSADEKQIGVTRFDANGRLPFPELISFDGKPLALAVGPLGPNAKPTLAVIVLDANEGRSLVTRTAAGQTTTQKLNKDFKSNPTTLLFHDVNQDGRVDLVGLVPFEKVKVLLQGAGKDFDEFDVAPPGGAEERQPWLSVADVDGDGKPELLMAQKNFLRAVVLKPEAAAAGSTNKTGWVFQVKDQINGAASNSRLVGAAAVARGTNPIPSLFLLDAERKALTLCERDAAGVWQVVRNLALPVSEFSRLQPVAWGGRAANSVAFLGLNSVAWLPLKGDVWEFTTLDGYETPIKDGYLNDVVSGDLDQDGRKDLVFMETAKNHLDLVIFDANHKLIPADRWQVFEQKTFRGRAGEMAEPREALVVDVTGDRKNDLVVVVHDRVLVYPQE
ncbi:MAG: VCBS repeat-containing protein [Verrucomicrobia subdivision 3 bacterium]|nr:VCBS repeat-containing protein [Limisphaerales bacterium]